MVDKSTITQNRDSGSFYIHFSSKDREVINLILCTKDVSDRMYLIRCYLERIFLFDRNNKMIIEPMVLIIYPMNKIDNFSIIPNVTN